MQPLGKRTGEWEAYSIPTQAQTSLLSSSGHESSQPASHPQPHLMTQTSNLCLSSDVTTAAVCDLMLPYRRTNLHPLSCALPIPRTPHMVHTVLSSPSHQLYADNI